MIRSHQEDEFKRCTVGVGGISSMTEDSDYNNHDHNEEDRNMNIDSDIENAMEENHIYRAQNRERKPCTDWKQYMIK